MRTIRTNRITKNASRLGEKGQGRIDALLDKAECVEEFAARSKDVGELIGAVKSLFADFDQEGKPQGAVVLSSVHKGKGIESARVFILRPDLIPHPKARQKWAQEQEKNLSYVAVTRAKYEQGNEESGVLVFVGGMPEMFREAGVRTEMVGQSFQAGQAIGQASGDQTIADLPPKQFPDNIPEGPKPAKGRGKEPRRDAKTGTATGTAATARGAGRERERPSRSRNEDANKDKARGREVAGQPQKRRQGKKK